MKEIPMKDIPHEKRRKILLDLQVMEGADVRKKYRISQNTLSHINFFHGKSNAKAQGHYYKDLIGDDLHFKARRIKEIKDAGGNSIQAAETTKIPLDKVNKLWITL